MTLSFLKQTVPERLQKLNAEMKCLDQNIDLTKYRSMTSESVSDHIEQLVNRNLEIKETVDFGQWLSNEEYILNDLLVEFLGVLRDTKKIMEETDVPVSGMTYYRDVSVVNNILTAKKCRFLDEGRCASWQPISEHVAVAKAKVFLEHGSIPDFLKIYVEMANGRPDGTINPSVDHLYESSDDALEAIMEYCDSKWNGPWPWETGAPYKLQKQIKEAKEMNMDSILALHDDFQKILREFEEGGQEKYAVITQAQDMSNEIHKIIERLGKISGEGILMIQDGVRTTMGDNAASNLAEHLNDPINDAAESLSKLRAAIDEVIESLETGSFDGNYDGDINGGSDMGGMDDLGGNDDLGSPMDALGGNNDQPENSFGGDDLSDELADMSLDGSQTERPKKDM